MAVYTTPEEAELDLGRRLGSIKNCLAIAGMVTTSIEVVEQMESFVTGLVAEFFEARRAVPIRRRAPWIEQDESPFDVDRGMDETRLRWEHRRAVERVEGRLVLAQYASDELFDAKIAERAVAAALAAAEEDESSV